jgi:hypothetical protein
MMSYIGKFTVSDEASVEEVIEAVLIYLVQEYKQRAKVLNDIAYKHAEDGDFGSAYLAHVQSETTREITREINELRVDWPSYK